MLSIDEDALTCDLAETYGVYDMRSLPATLVATFSCGLRENSRIKMKMQNQTVPLEEILLAAIVDRLSLLVWFKTKDAEHGFNRPECLVDKLTNKVADSDVMIFDSPEEFDAYLAELKSK